MLSGKVGRIDSITHYLSVYGESLYHITISLHNNIQQRIPVRIILYFPFRLQRFRNNRSKGQGIRTGIIDTHEGAERYAKISGEAP